MTNINKYGGRGYGYTRKVNGKWWGWGACYDWEFVSTCVLVH